MRAGATGGSETLDAGLVLTSVGYRGVAVPGLPFDERAGVVPNDAGRVVESVTGAPVPGSYVTGWIKRGPTGFIGTNKSCAQETVRQLVDDPNAGRLSRPRAGAEEFDRLVQQRRPDVIRGGATTARPWWKRKLLTRV